MSYVTVYNNVYEKFMRFIRGCGHASSSPLREGEMEGNQNHDSLATHSYYCKEKQICFLWEIPEVCLSSISESLAREALKQSMYNYSEL